MPQRFEGLFLRSGEGWGFFIDDYVNHSGDAFLCTQYMYKKVRNRSDEGSNESNAQPVSRAVYIGDKYVHVHTHTHTRTHSHSPAHLTSKKNKTGVGASLSSCTKGAFGHWSDRKCMRRVSGRQRSVSSRTAKGSK